MQLRNSFSLFPTRIFRVKFKLTLRMRRLVLWLIKCPTESSIVFSDFPLRVLLQPNVNACLVPCWPATWVTESTYLMSVFLSLFCISERTGRWGSGRRQGTEAFSHVQTALKSPDVPKSAAHLSFCLQSFPGALSQSRLLSDTHSHVAFSPHS